MGKKKRFPLELILCDGINLIYILLYINFGLTVWIKRNVQGRLPGPTSAWGTFAAVGVFGLLVAVTIYASYVMRRDPVRGLLIPILMFAGLSVLTWSQLVVLALPYAVCLLLYLIRKKVDPYYNIRETNV